MSNLERYTQVKKLRCLQEMPWRCINQKQALYMPGHCSPITSSRNESNWPEGPTQTLPGRRGGGDGVPSPSTSHVNPVLVIHLSPVRPEARRQSEPIYEGECFPVALKPTARRRRTAQDVNVPRYRLTCAGNTSNTTVSANFDRDVFRPGDVTSPPVAVFFRGRQRSRRPLQLRFDFDATAIWRPFDRATTTRL